MRERLSSYLVAVVVVFVGLAVAGAGRAEAKLKSELVAYKQGKTVLEGYLAWDDEAPGKRPAVLIVHDWMGIGEHTRAVADKLAAAGYVAFAVDVYGKGVRPTTREDAGKQAGKLKGDRALLRARARAGLDWLAKHKAVDATKIVATGYCFGGTAALELARSGAALVGTVSFHGGLDTPNPADAKKIKGKVLVLHGADDPGVPPAQVAAFEQEMRDAGIDWQLFAYGGAVHAFTNPKAGNDNSKGAAYNEKADRRSWEALLAFLREVFA